MEKTLFFFKIILITEAVKKNLLMNRATMETKFDLLQSKIQNEKIWNEDYGLYK